MCHGSLDTKYLVEIKRKMYVFMELTGRKLTKTCISELYYHKLCSLTKYDPEEMTFEPNIQYVQVPALLGDEGRTLRRLEISPNAPKWRSD